LNICTDVILLANAPAAVGWIDPQTVSGTGTGTGTGTANGAGAPPAPVAQSSSAPITPTTTRRSRGNGATVDGVASRNAVSTTMEAVSST
jgi:hypothetical protein